ncbi:hypothetical protein E2562_018372 [Oryza meyeriana var. granulata]|uniref:Uncharacterized protein n=1 Tax=Oryza meyeriana var. granulata TaxID=110450 RepID=A0A6G1D5X8_9ORYZ|nr:hypothetical protein E2562_018372 [Oryza meyeriana var. granulata]
MAAADDYYGDDDDEYEEYNPHPYSGGYDIFATYGSPIPPSPTTCYPISSSATPAAPPPQPSLQPKPAPVPPVPTPPKTRPPSPPAPAPSPAPQPSPAQPRAVSPEPPPPVAEPYYWPKPYDYGDAQRDQPVYATPEVFRSWPYLAGAQCHSRCGRDYWRQCMRGLDYLFGHTDGYGERRIGVDSHGIPVYANRKGGVEDAVVIQVEPPATGTVEWHYAGEELDYSNGNRLSWNDNAKAETYAYAQPNYGSYDGSYEQSYSLDAVSDETAWFPKQNYQHVYKEEESQYQEILSSSYVENKISTQPIYCYNQQFSEQPLHVLVEPPETVYSQKLEYYEGFSTYNNHNSTDDSDMLGHSYDIQPDEHVPDESFEPIKLSWSMNSGYYQSCTDGASAEFENHTLSSSEFGGIASLFATSFYPQQTQIYECHGDENVFLQQNWQCNWNVISENDSQSGKLLQYISII